MGLLALLVPIAISLFIYHNQGKKSTRNLGVLIKMPVKLKRGKLE